MGTVTHSFRIAPTNRIIIEWRADLPSARWCFYKVCDSPNDAKRALGLLNGTGHPQTEQQELLEVDA